MTHLAGCTPPQLPTVGIAELLQGAAHGRLDAQVATLGSHRGGSEETVQGA